MRVAVLITGQLRDYKVNSINHLKNLIKPNNADVFFYICNKNTIHSTGESLEQKYIMQNEYSEKEIRDSIKSIYGDFIREININTQEKLNDENFGTLGYFRNRMQNQIINIRKGFEMAKNFSINNNFSYDLIVRCRPDNSFFPKVINLKHFNYKNDLIYSTRFEPSGHRDICFFAISNVFTFEKYCSFEYLNDEDPSRTDNNFECLEFMLEKYLNLQGVKTKYISNICVPFSGFDKTKPIIDFPHRNKKEKLLDSKGNYVEQILPIKENILKSNLIKIKVKRYINVVKSKIKKLYKSIKI